MHRLFSVKFLIFLEQYIKFLQPRGLLNGMDFPL